MAERISFPLNLEKRDGAQFSDILGRTGQEGQEAPAIRQEEPGSSDGINVEGSEGYKRS